MICSIGSNTNVFRECHWVFCFSGCARCCRRAFYVVSTCWAALVDSRQPIRGRQCSTLALAMVTNVRHDRSAGARPATEPAPAGDGGLVFDFVLEKVCCAAELSSTNVDAAYVFFALQRNSRVFLQCHFCGNTKLSPCSRNSCTRFFNFFGQEFAGSRFFYYRKVMPHPEAVRRLMAPMLPYSTTRQSQRALSSAVPGWTQGYPCWNLFPGDQGVGQQVL